jgi:hypothetical protein
VEYWEGLVDAFLPKGQIWDLLMQVKGLRAIKVEDMKHEFQCATCADLDPILRSLEKAILANKA